MVYNSAQQVTAPQVQQGQKPKNAEMFRTRYNTHEHPSPEDGGTHGQTGVLCPVTLEIRCGERDGEMLKITLGLSPPLL